MSYGFAARKADGSSGASGRRAARGLAGRAGSHTVDLAPGAALMRGPMVTNVIRQVRAAARATAASPQTRSRLRAPGHMRPAALRVRARAAADLHAVGLAGLPGGGHAPRHGRRTADAGAVAGHHRRRHRHHTAAAQVCERRHRPARAPLTNPLPNHTPTAPALPGLHPAPAPCCHPHLLPRGHCRRRTRCSRVSVVVVGGAPSDALLACIGGRSPPATRGGRAASWTWSRASTSSTR